MDLANRIEKRYLEYGQWSQTAYVHPKASKQSIHRSQLDFTRDKIQRLNILNGDGTTIEFEGSECKQLRLGFTGGTDDPSIELSLRDFISDPWTAHDFIQTISYRFTAFASSETDFVFEDRRAEYFSPGEQAENIVSDDFLGPTSFTDSLYGLCFERFVKDDTAYLRLSWRSRRMITYGLNLATRDGTDHLGVAGKFCDIAEKQKRFPSQPQIFTVEVLDQQAIQYQYRYLLACPTGLQAYWRYRLLPNMAHGAVPANLCELLPLRSREIQELESPDPDIKTAWDDSKWFPDSNCALAAVYTFSSIAQVEFYVKGGLLYEEHAISLLRKRNLHLCWNVEFEQLRQKQVDGSVSIWVAILTLVDPSPNSTRAVRPDILPKEGSSVPLRWMLRENQKGMAGPWKGVLLKAEVGFSQRVRLAVLVWPQTSSSLSAIELTRTHRPAFDFSLEPENLGFMLNSMDKLLFLDKPSQPSNPTAKRILEVLMARDNSKEIEEIFSTMYFDERMRRVSSHMNSAQYKAMLTLSKRLITLVDGPVSSGKTMIGSVFGALSICLGEKVTFLAKTKNALKNLFLKVVEVSKSLDLSSAVTDQFSLTDNLCPLPSGDQELDDMLSRVEWTGKYKFSMPIRTASRFTSSKSGNGVPTAQFTTYDELESLNGEFGTTLLICIEAEQAHDHSIFAACGLSACTLKKVALFGNSDKVPVGVTSRDLNHLRSQVELTTFWRLVCTGVETTKLHKQYGMHPEISALPTRHLYWTKSSMKRDVDDGFNLTFPERELMQKWVAEYFNRKTKKAKLSVFANVKDGICLQDSHGSAKANHHNMVAILDILRSMMGCKLPRKSIIILTFFPEAVIAIQEFLTSQDVSDIRVEYIGSENISTEGNLIAIVDCPMTGHVTREIFQGKKGEGESLRILCRTQRLASALCVPRVLRVFVGNDSLVKSKSGYGWQGSQGHGLITDLVMSHRKDQHVKSIKIGDRLLEYQEVLRPQDYVFAFDKTRSAMELYEKPAEVEKRKAQDARKVEHDTRSNGSPEKAPVTTLEKTLKRSQDMGTDANDAEADANVADNPSKRRKVGRYGIVDWDMEGDGNVGHQNYD